jgi:hypothetical protein
MLSRKRLAPVVGKPSRDLEIGLTYFCRHQVFADRQTLSRLHSGKTFPDQTNSRKPAKLNLELGCHGKLRGGANVPDIPSALILLVALADTPRACIRFARYHVARGAFYSI